MPVRARGALLRSVVVAAALIPVSCGSDGDGNGGGTLAPSESVPPGTLEIVASFYPLQFVTQLVGGDRVSVTNLTPVGAEPHDLELTGDDAAGLQDADLVVLLSGFTPALDDAVTRVAAGHSFDVADAARLDIEGSAADDPELDGESETSIDPHFWLDPTRLADVADAIAARLAAIDPAGAETFTQNAANLRTQLLDLDAEFEAGLENCVSQDIVTSHQAFGYLAQRYSLTQVGISGLSPDEEPSPADLARVTEFVRDNGVTTIYFETLVDPAIAETVAAETGAATKVLDPIEGVSGDSQGSDYFEIMRANLSNLRNGQGCA